VSPHADVVLCLVCAEAEAQLLAAKKPELAIKMYKDMSLWDDALRVAREHKPNIVSELRQQQQAAQPPAFASPYATPSSSSLFATPASGSSGALSSSPSLVADTMDAILAAARAAENKRDFSRAVECYLRVRTHMCAHA
jgi:hypothetical protein